MEKKTINLIMIAGVLSLLFVGVFVTVYPFAPTIVIDKIPDAPSLYSVESPNTDGSVELSWSRPDQTEYFELYRFRGVGWFYIGKIYRTSYIDNNVADGYTYKYKVIAANSLGDSPDSNVVTVEIDLTDEPPLPPLPPLPPEAPELNLIESPSIDGNIHISWSSVSDATDYTVYRSDNDEDDYELLGKVYITTYDDSDLIDGTYYYKVKAGNDVGEYSDYSDVESVIVAIPGVPNAPKTNDITYEIVDSGIEITVSWSEVSCNSYNLYRAIVSDTKDTGYVLIEEDLTSTSYSVVLTNDIAKYFYKVSAVNDLGESEQSNPTIINVTGDGVEPDELLDDYTWLYVLLGVLGVAVVPVVILTKRKKK